MPSRRSGSGRHLNKPTVLQHRTEFISNFPVNSSARKADPLFPPLPPSSSYDRPTDRPTTLHTSDIHFKQSSAQRSVETSVRPSGSVRRACPASVRGQQGQGRAAAKEMPSTKPNKTWPPLFIFVSARKDLSFRHKTYYIGAFFGGAAVFRVGCC